MLALEPAQQPLLKVEVSISRRSRPFEFGRSGGRQAEALSCQMCNRKPRASRGSFVPADEGPRLIFFNTQRGESRLLVNARKYWLLCAPVDASPYLVFPKR
jgi:hypothetical protein